VQAHGQKEVDERPVNPFERGRVEHADFDLGRAGFWANARLRVVHAAFDEDGARFFKTARIGWGQPHDEARRAVDLEYDPRLGCADER
jgi:hypothetical protein